MSPPAGRRKRAPSATFQKAAHPTASPATEASEATEAPAPEKAPATPRKPRAPRASTPAAEPGAKPPTAAKKPRARRTPVPQAAPPAPVAPVETPVRAPVETPVRAPVEAVGVAPLSAPPEPPAAAEPAPAPAPPPAPPVTRPAPTAALRHVAEPPLRPRRTRPSWLHLGTPLRVVLAVVFVANVLVLTGSPIPGLAPLAGVVLVLVLPTMLLWQKLDWVDADPAERIVCSLGVVLLGLMLGGLLLNQVLGFAGVARPLDRTPVLVAVDLGLIGLLSWRRDRLRLPENVFRRLPEGSRLIAGGALAVVAAIIGAMRLNNGASGTFTVLMLVAVTSIFALVILRRARLTTTVISIVLYELGLATLLMTSLRGWYVTGHDIQLEYQVFQLTARNGIWDMSRFQDPYNACMSIT
ncbi:MAG: hypothetical protein QOH95_1955, partial [Gaiellaceae bacterium]|nr:hypothetical protein [Gaiellaceae bacterium]